jgi:hypothetical protein
LAVALWNGRGRCAFSLDSSGTHSYAKQAFKFRQARSQEDGVLDDRYFDIVVEYANTSPEDLLVQITASNRGAAPAVLHIVPTLWFRQTRADQNGRRPVLRDRPGTGLSVIATHPEFGERFLYADAAVALLFTNDTSGNSRYIRVKASASCHLTFAGGQSQALRLRLTDVRFGADESTPSNGPFGSAFDAVMTERRRGATSGRSSTTESSYVTHPPNSSV